MGKLITKRFRTGKASAREREGAKQVRQEKAQMKQAARIARQQAKKK